jgi:hypothetical protein
MKKASPLLLGMLGPLFIAGLALGQQPGPGPACPGASACTQTPCCGSPCSGPHGLNWTRSCFPCKSCPDDYCPNPYPRQCWPPYPPFYQCVPAGTCCRDTNKDRLTWWFLPRPRSLREALWCHPE